MIVDNLIARTDEARRRLPLVVLVYLIRRTATSTTRQADYGQCARQQ
jgi:hypothetical protein